MITNEIQQNQAIPCKDRRQIHSALTCLTGISIAALLLAGCSNDINAQPIDSTPFPPRCQTIPIKHFYGDTTALYNIELIDDRTPQRPHVDVFTSTESGPGIDPRRIRDVGQRVFIQTDDYKIVKVATFDNRPPYDVSQICGDQQAESALHDDN